MALRSPRFPALITALALVLVLVPFAGSAEARRGKPHRPPRAAVAHKPPTVPKVIGQPPLNYVMPAGSFFSFPNRSKLEQVAIRNRVLLTIKSVWGGRRTSVGTPLPANGSIRMATWSFDDWAVARALVAARDRGVTVQVVAAKDANKGHGAWRWLRKKLRSATYVPGHPSTRDTVSFARQCRGACRGTGGTAHSKYFLFDNVGAGHARRVSMQTSMNLTTMGFQGQWNQAQVTHSARIYADFMSMFRQARLALSVPRPYHSARNGQIINYFFPRPRAKPAQDPIMANLNKVTCQFTVPGVGARRSVVRVIQYAVYGNRGVGIAKKLRALWDSGCDVAVIYSLATRPVLRILGSRAGRGPIPVRQSVITNSAGDIVKYNHSKWMAIAGRVGTANGQYVTVSGSANWSDIAFTDDEQTQRIEGRTTVARHFAAFATTWRQKSSRRPAAARVRAGGRMIVTPLELPAEDPEFGKGIYRYLTPD